MPSAPSAAATPVPLAPQDDGPLPAAALDVARGLCRMLIAAGQVAMAEVPLPNGRRADLLAIDAQGFITIFEIKVSRADLLGDRKWPDYLPWCDRFAWAISAEIDPALLDAPERQPDRCGLVVADRYEAQWLRAPAEERMAPPRRKAETLRLARLSLRRAMVAADPPLSARWGEGKVAP